MQWTLLSVQILLLLPHGCELVNVSSGTSSPDQYLVKRLYVCVFVCLSHIRKLGGGHGMVGVGGSPRPSQLQTQPTHQRRQDQANGE